MGTYYSDVLKKTGDVAGDGNGAGMLSDGNVSVEKCIHGGVPARP